MSGTGPRLVEILGMEAASCVQAALGDWLDGQAQHVLDLVNATSGKDREWAVDDNLATNSESLASVARIVAELGQALDMASRP